tara:strand:+ start:387 stop:1106 length:720 start_codon:yes stop_codon:yes gene_type:complete
MFNLEYVLSLSNTDRSSIAEGSELFVVQYEPAVRVSKLYFLNKQKNCLYKYSNGLESYQYFGDRTKNWRDDEPDYGSNLRKVAEHLGIGIDLKDRICIDVVEDDDYYINFQAAERKAALQVVKAVMWTYSIGSEDMLSTMNAINGTEWNTIEQGIEVDGVLGIKIPCYSSKNSVKLYSKPFRPKIGGDLKFNTDIQGVLDKIYDGKFTKERQKELILGMEPTTKRYVIYCFRNHVRHPV